MRQAAVKPGPAAKPAPALPAWDDWPKAALAARLDELLRENAALARELALAQRRSQRRAAEYLRRIDLLEAELRHARAAAAAVSTRPAASPAASGSACAPQQPPRTVLCVGARVQNLPLVRIEAQRHGARLLHHDGASEGIDAPLQAADLVICQTGCIGHEAYWRVQDHCRRTGKRCLFVDTPSRAALAQAWAALHDARLPLAAAETETQR